MSPRIAVVLGTWAIGCAGEARAPLRAPVRAATAAPAAPIVDPPHVAGPRPAPEPAPARTAEEASAALDAALAAQGIANRDLLLEREVGGPARVTGLAQVLFALAQLPEESGLVLYAHDGRRLEVFLVREGGLVADAVVEVSSDRLDALASEIRAAIGVERAPARAPSRAGGFASEPGPTRAAPPGESGPDEALRRAGRTLLPPPVARALSDLRHLVVVPTRGIGTVPFAALRPFDDGSALVDHLSITIAPSAADVLGPPDAWTPHFESALVVGDPRIPGRIPGGLQPLPGARREATLVHDAVGGRTLVGDEATEAEVARGAAGADLLYLASHGLSDAADPLDSSYLVLADGDGADGRWTAREIQSSDLGHARLAVLSACQTGLGRMHDGGMIGLARAFQIAGVPRVVMSLWDVDDLWTARLMQRFVAHLATEPPASALRLAMLDVRAASPSPATWAAFAAFGVLDRVREPPPLPATRSPRACFERALMRNPALEGTVVVEFDVVTDRGRGVVRNARVAESTVDDPAIGVCAVEAITARVFPAARGGGIVHVRYPFRFERVE